MRTNWISGEAIGNIILIIGLILHENKHELLIHLIDHKQNEKMEMED